MPTTQERKDAIDSIRAHRDESYAAYREWQNLLDLAVNALHLAERVDTLTNND